MSSTIKTQPLFIRLFHWSFAAAILILVFTGLQITNPVDVTFIKKMDMRTIRGLHKGAGFASMPILGARIIYGFFTGNYKLYKINREKLKTLKHLVKYYVFIEETRPPVLPKYNIGQILTQWFWLVGYILLTIGGIILLDPERYFMILRRIGGLQTIRLVKYLLTIPYLITILVHIYLAFLEDPAKLQAMITGALKKKEAGEEENR